MSQINIEKWQRRIRNKRETKAQRKFTNLFLLIAHEN